MKKLLCILSLSFGSYFGFAQSGCGTDYTEEDRLFINQFVQEYRSGSIDISRDLGDSMVPVKFHIISTDFGTGGIDSASVFDELDSINSFYKNAGIKFYHCDNIDYINSSDHVYFEKYTSEDLCDSLDLDDVINIYFAPNVYKYDEDSNSVGLCGYAYMSSTTKNRIIMDNGCSTNGSTLAHELGHYFSLPHTHTTSNGAELVDGSNCSFAGDLFCDTPADPTLSSSIVDSNCDYTGTDTDGNGDSYNPDTGNIMSYSRKSCRDHFSAMQYQQMQYYLVSFKNYLRCPSTPLPSGIDHPESLEIIIYPNPTSGAFTIEGTEDIDNVRLIDQMGREIYNTIHLTTSSTQTFDLNLRSGFYIVTVTTSKGQLNYRLFVD